MGRTQLNGRQVLDNSIELGVDTAGVLPVQQGGTGKQTHTIYALLIGNGNGQLMELPPAQAGYAIVSNGTQWIAQAVATGGGSGTPYYVPDGNYTVPENKQTLFNANIELENGDLIIDGLLIEV